MSQALGNMIDEARVSQATRRDARGQKDPFQLKEAVASLQRELDGLNARKCQIEGKLAIIKSTIRGTRRLPQSQYHAVVSEQGELVAEMKDNETRRIDLSNRIKQMRADMPQDQWNGGSRTNELLAAILDELRAIRATLQEA